VSWNHCYLDTSSHYPAVAPGRVVCTCCYLNFTRRNLPFCSATYASLDGIPPSVPLPMLGFALLVCYLRFARRNVPFRSATCAGISPSVLLPTLPSMQRPLRLLPIDPSRSFRIVPHVYSVPGCSFWQEQARSACSESPVTTIHIHDGVHAMQHLQ
jgi:hypothetical protein